MNRITQRLNDLKAQGRKALISYVVAGDAGKEATVPTMHELVKAGTDIIELGVPFSDPAAEGPVIQLAHERALANKTSLKDTMAMVAEFRMQDSETPVVLMGYCNPVERMGYQTFATAAKEVGVDGLLTVDLPPEEAAPLNAELKAAEIESIFLLAPTSTQERIKMVSELAGGFIYYVSLKGVTGAGHLDTTSVEEKLAEIRAETDLPVCVGFGIKDADSAQAVGKVSEGVVVGSVLVNKMAALQAETPDLQVLAQETASPLVSMREALDKL